MPTYLWYVHIYLLCDYGVKVVSLGALDDEVD